MHTPHRSASHPESPVKVSRAQYFDFAPWAFYRQAGPGKGSPLPLKRRMGSRVPKHVFTSIIIVIQDLVRGACFNITSGASTDFTLRGLGWFSK
jgi:hypothetical protein